MLYLVIDQHAIQITVCVRNEEGDTVLRRQVSSRPEKIEALFQQRTEMLLVLLRRAIGDGVTFSPADWTSAV